MDNPKPILPDGRESLEKAEKPQRQQLDDATFEPRSVIEQAGGHEQSEAVQKAFGGMMDKVHAPVETTKDPAHRLPGEENLPRSGSIPPINPPNAVGSSEGAVRAAGANPKDEGRIPNPQAEAPGPAGESNRNPTVAGQSPESEDLTSEKQLKLQEMMEKKTQIQQTLSNVEKKLENTQRDLIANLK